MNRVIGEHEGKYKVLFTLDEWEILKWNHYKGSFIFHLACSVSMERQLANKNPTCAGCGVVVPADILALWLMDNWYKVRDNDWMSKERE